MDLDQRIAEAARQAISELELSAVEYDSLYLHQDSERVTVHFREGQSYFSIEIIPGNHPDPELSPQTGVEVLTDQIAIELRKRYPED
jgi:hypothetical protein